MLILPIKKKWFDMIVSGEKTEEYREIKPYYFKRFRNIWGYPAYWGEPHKIGFRNGYSRYSPLIVAECTLATRTGKPEWVHGMFVMIGRNDLSEDETLVQNIALAINNAFKVKGDDNE